MAVLLLADPPEVRNVIPRAGPSFTLGELGRLIPGTGPIVVHELRPMVKDKVFDVLIIRQPAALDGLPPLNVAATSLLLTVRIPVRVFGAAVHAVQIRRDAGRGPEDAYV